MLNFTVDNTILEINEPKENADDHIKSFKISSQYFILNNPSKNIKVSQNNQGSNIKLTSRLIKKNTSICKNRWILKYYRNFNYIILDSFSYYI